MFEKECLADYLSTLNTLTVDITYKILTPADAAAYRLIRLEALRLFADNFGSNYAEEKAKPKLAFEGFIEQQTPGRFIAGAFDNGELIGICGFARDESFKSNHKGLVIQMYVRQKYSGRGVGRQLLQTVIQRAFTIPGVEQLILGVITTNTSAIKLYEKVGFTAFGIHHNYFKDGDNYQHQQFMILYKNELPV